MHGQSPTVLYFTIPRGCVLPMAVSFWEEEPEVPTTANIPADFAAKSGQISAIALQDWTLMLHASVSSSFDLALSKPHWTLFRARGSHSLGSPLPSPTSALFSPLLTCIPRSIPVPFCGAAPHDCNLCNLFPVVLSLGLPNDLRNLQRFLNHYLRSHSKILKIEDQRASFGGLHKKSTAINSMD